MGNVIPIRTKPLVRPFRAPSDSAAEGQVAKNHPRSPLSNITCCFQPLYHTYESSASAESLTTPFPFVVYNYLAIYQPYFPGALLTAKAEYNMLILLANKLGNLSSR